MPEYILDACALIAFLNSESGGEKVKELLILSSQKQIKLSVHIINIYEVYYDYLKRNHAKESDIINDLYTLPMTVIDSIDTKLIIESGKFKATYSLSLADSIALGLCVKLKSVLVTADHQEFDVIERDKLVTFNWIR